MSEAAAAGPAGTGHENSPEHFRAPGCHTLCGIPAKQFCLEQAADGAGLGVDVDSAVRRVRTGTGHHGDGAGHRAKELGSAVLQDVSDFELPSLGNSLEGRIVGE